MFALIERPPLLVLCVTYMLFNHFNYGLSEVYLFVDFDIPMLEVTLDKDRRKIFHVC